MYFRIWQKTCRTMVGYSHVSTVPGLPFARTQVGEASVATCTGALTAFNSVHAVSCSMDTTSSLRRHSEPIKAAWKRHSGLQ